MDVPEDFRTMLLAVSEADATRDNLEAPPGICSAEEATKSDCAVRIRIRCWARRPLSPFRPQWPTYVGIGPRLELGFAQKRGRRVAEGR